MAVRLVARACVHLVLVRSSAIGCGLLMRLVRACVRACVRAFSSDACVRVWLRVVGACSCVGCSCVRSLAGSLVLVCARVACSFC